MRSFALGFGIALVGLCWAAAVASAADEQCQPLTTLFDSAPSHPWNRLHALFIREAAPGGLVELGSGRPSERPPLAAGQVYVPEGPDAPFGHATLSVIQWWPSYAANAADRSSTDS